MNLSFKKQSGSHTYTKCKRASIITLYLPMVVTLCVPYKVLSFFSCHSFGSYALLMLFLARNSLHTTLIRNRLLLLFYYLNQTRRHFWFALITDIYIFWMVRKNNIRLLVDRRSSSRKFHQIRSCAFCQALTFVLSAFCRIGTG